MAGSESDPRSRSGSSVPTVTPSIVGSFILEKIIDGMNDRGPLKNIVKETVAGLLG